MSHVSNFTHSDKRIITALILYDNPGLILEPDDVDYLNPDARADALNTTITVAMRPTAAYSGMVDVNYNRLLVSDFIDMYFEEGLMFKLPTPGTLYDLLPAINLALGINLTESEVVDQDLPEFDGSPNEQHVIEVPIRSGSLIYRGTFRFTIQAEPISLVTVIPVTQLTGLNLPSITPAT